MYKKKVKKWPRGHIQIAVHPTNSPEPEDIIPYAFTIIYKNICWFQILHQRPLSPELLLLSTVRPQKGAQ